MAKRLGLRLGFLASSVFAFWVGWFFVSLALLVCAILGHYRACGITRNIWCGILPYKLWSDSKPCEYKSYANHLKLRLQASLRFLLCRETLADISVQDSFQVNFSDFFSTNESQGEVQNCDKEESEYSYLYGDWNEGKGSK